MPSAEHSRIVQAPLPDIWEFVRDMDNWAPLVTGYQRHEKLSDTESLWFLKGELGGLTRIAEFKVKIEEWDDSGQVRFSLTGVNEPVTGSGSFHVTSVQPAGEPAGAVAEHPRSRRRDTILRWLLAKIFGQPVPLEVKGGQSRPTAHESLIVMQLTLTAGGMAGMVLNALLTPMMKPVAEALADNIAAAITERGEAMPYRLSA